MSEETKPAQFAALNTAYNRVFRPSKLSLGLVVPLEAYPNTAAPTMSDHLARAQLVDRLGFASLWLRDVPFNVPSFGDAGQVFDPFVYLGYLAAATDRIALGVASVILPLRHPAHVAKSAASADVLSGGRVLMGVASGDRPEEYPAMGMSFPDRGERFRDSFDYIRQMGTSYPAFELDQGVSHGGMDMLPKPSGARLPMLVTGGSRQDPDWTAANADGWITYPRDLGAQARVVQEYRARIQAVSAQDQPISQSLYVDFLADEDAPPRAIHLGFQSGIGFLRTYLRGLEEIGINHVAINLRFNQAPFEDTLHRIAETLLPDFSDQ